VSVSWSKLKVTAKPARETAEKPAKGELSAGDIVAYITEPQSTGDYYSEADQAFMMWHTTERAAVELGIAKPGQPPSQQEVLRSTLTALLEGKNPSTGEFIRRRRAGGDGTRVAALDVTVSPAPKSVSALWAVGSKQLKYELETMVAMAADRAVMRMLREQPFVRRTNSATGEVEHVQAEDFVAVSAMHTTARMSPKGRGVPDPQLHLHYLLIGALDESGKLRALDSYTLTQYRAELAAEASGHLADLLRQRGFEIERRLEYRKDKKGREVPRVAWEVRGVPASLIQAMSSRTTEIAELKARFMKETGLEPVGRRWDAWIIKQRGPKSRLTSEELLRAWIEEADEHGFGPEAVEQLVALANLRRAIGIPTRAERSPQADELRDLVLEHVCREHAFVPESYLFRLAHELAVGLVGAEYVDRVLIRMVREGDLLVTKGDRKITTLEVLAWEQRARRGVRRLLEAPPNPMIPAEEIAAELRRREAEGTPFDEHQLEAVVVAVSGARFVSITGPAGTGKGVTSAAITALFQGSTIRLLQGRGRRVIALAVPGRTAQQAGVDAKADLAMTIDGLVHRVRAGGLQLTGADVLLVDEAGMIDHARYADILEAAADAGTTVIQVGDDKQLSPVGPGGLWTSTHQMASASGTAAELSVVRRAPEEKEAQAWTDIREGRVVEGLLAIRDAGRLRLHDTREQLREGMVTEWWEAGPNRGLMVVDTSNEERDLLNQLAQWKRLEAGEIGPEALRLDERRELRTGDQVLFTAIYRPAQAGAESGRWIRRVENGTRAVVQAVDLERRLVELELHEPVKEDAGGHRPPPRRLWVGTDLPVELGYARHVQKAQGVTIWTGDIAVSLRTRLNELYVMISRAREGVRLHALTAELEEVVEDLQEVLAELEAERQAQAEQMELPGLEDQANGHVPLWKLREEADREDHLLPAERRALEGRPQLAALPPPSPDPLEQLRDAIAQRRAEQELGAIQDIGRHAKPSTKEAVGDRPISESADASPAWEGGDGHRWTGRGSDDVARQDRAAGRWRRSPRLDPRAPQRAREAAEEAAQGRVAVPTSAAKEPDEFIARVHRQAGISVDANGIVWTTKAPVEPARTRERLALPAQDARESLARAAMDAPDTGRAMGYLQLAGRVEYSSDPMASAIERLEADPEAVLVVGRAQEQRAWEELGKRSQLEADVRERDRLVIAEDAYQQRVEHRQRIGAERHRVEEEPRVGRGIVVAEEAWASPELSRALSVAAASQLVSPPPGRVVAEEAQAFAEQHQRAEQLQELLYRSRSAEERGVALAVRRDPHREAAQGSAQQAELAQQISRQRSLEAEEAAPAIEAQVEAER
jgi:conjugative relaxase-like TrwC/TraI family protein